MRVDQVRERRERKESSLWITLVILLLTCTTIGSINIGTVSGKELPVIYVDPPTSTAAPNETFAVNIKVANITADESLYGWQFRMSFNTAVLDAVSVVEGPFLKNINSTFFKKKINNTEGTVNALATLIPPYPEVGAVGNGTLCTITFKVEAKKATLLHFDSTELYTVIYGNLLEIDHEVVDGIFDNREPPFLPPVAVFEPKPRVAKVNETITFNASASYDPDAWLINYEWDFGDNTTDIYKGENLTAIVTHAYDQGGTYTVKLTVTDYDNLTDTATAEIAVGHDVAVTSLDAPTKATIGDLVSINVTVANEGDFNETLTVTVSYDSTEIDTTTFTLNEGLSETVEFSWNTTGLALGTYTINATATITLDEDPGDNFKTTTIEIKPYVFTVTGPGWEFNVIVDSNSSVSSFEFRQEDMRIRFTVSGPTGTTGYCNVAIPMGLLKGPWTILVDNVSPAHVFESDNGTHTFLYFTYTHSTKDVIIRGEWVVPEFPTLIPLLLTLAFLAVSTIILKRKIGNNC